MKDIDFDELDKAVNSVLNQEEQATAPVVVDTTTPASEPVDVPTENAAPAVVAAPAPANVDSSADVPSAGVVSPEPVVVETQEAESQPETSSSLATKRRGKFMDVVHPSSDMNPTASAAVAQSGPVVVSPLSPDLRASETDGDTIARSDNAKDAQVQESVVTPAEILETPFSPELDQAVQGSDEATTPPGETPVPGARTATTSADAETPDAVEASMPAEASNDTPFLTDAKVEKRPLGAFGEENSPETLEASSEHTEPSPDNSVAAAATGAAGTMPRELQSDIVEVEKVQDDTIEATAVPEVAPAAATTVSSDTGVPAPSGEVAHDEDAHPVFDASTYQQPLAPAKPSSKGKPAWMWWLLGTLACLVIGGGVGYVLFVSGF